MSKRTFVIGDIHGGFKALEQVISKVELSFDDQLIFLGDYVDGWSESFQVVEYLINLNQNYKCVFLKGNHDDLFLEWLETKKENKLWLEHGGLSTIQSYASATEPELKKHVSFFKSLKNYHLDSANRLFVHAGFTNPKGPLKEYYPYVFYWDRSLWETAIATDPSLSLHDLRYPKRFTHFDEIYIGHTPVTQLGHTTPLQALTVWNCDTGAGFKGPLSMLEINSKTLIQSAPVYQLYPDEIGRN